MKKKVSFVLVLSILVFSGCSSSFSSSSSGKTTTGQFIDAPVKGLT